MKQMLEISICVLFLLGTFCVSLKASLLPDVILLGQLNVFVPGKTALHILTVS